MKQVSYSKHANIRTHHKKFSLLCDLLLEFVHLCIEQKAGPQSRYGQMGRKNPCPCKT